MNQSSQQNAYEQQRQQALNSEEGQSYRQTIALEKIAASLASIADQLERFVYFKTR